MLNYAYLWDYEAQRGQTEGLKNRPSVVVVATTRVGDKLDVVVCPITSQKPKSGNDYVEIPPGIKLHLGLTDRDESFVVTTEINRFVWPGPDVRPFDKAGQRTVYHGAVTSKVLARIKASLLAHKSLRQVSRD